MPFASMSKVTSTWGTPRGREESPPVRTVRGSGCRPPSTVHPGGQDAHAGWLSAAVENTWLFLVGIVVFFSISLVMTPPSVSIPRERGLRQAGARSFTSRSGRRPGWPRRWRPPHRGSPLCGFLPENLLHLLLDPGHPGHPATRITSSMSLVLSFASWSAVWQDLRSFRSDPPRGLQFRPGQLDVHVLGARASAVMKAG